MTRAWLLAAPLIIALSLYLAFITAEIAGRIM